MAINKLQISSPLEAGTSLLEEKKLPSHLTEALEYVSSRLARKQIHLSFIVVRKSVNIPSAQSSPTIPSPVISPGLNSPARSLFDDSESTSSRSSMSSTSSATHSRTRWPSLPTSPKDRTASPPTSASSSRSSSASSSPCPSPTFSSSTPNSYGIFLMHANPISPRTEKFLRHTIAKAEKKFPVGSGWLSSQSLTAPITCPATNDLIRRSLAQNSVLFSSEGLTLLALDHVYTFKGNLHTYSRTLSASDLSATVDELRRLVLVSNGRSISQSTLTAAYPWLGISMAALSSVNAAYKAAYDSRGCIQVPLAAPVSAATSLKLPVLKTNFRLSETRKWGLEKLTPVEAGESAQGREGGAKTPNTARDITPVTRGDWMGLMGSREWVKTVPVATC